MDYVSYSTYDSLDDIPNKIPRALDYIETKLPAKPGIAGKRVFIGEYGFAAHTYPGARARPPLAPGHAGGFGVGLPVRPLLGDV